LELIGKHEGGFKGFSWLSKSYYAEPNLLGMDYKDEIMVGVYHEGDGTTGEFGIRWYKIGSMELCPQVQIFEDSFQVAFQECADLLAELVKLDGKNPQPEDIRDLLLKLGYRDTTPYKDPYEGSR
jgi:hypothetical protein